MTETREAIRGAATLALAGVVAAAVGWLTLVVVARTRGPSEYAEFSVVWSIYFAVAGVLIGLQQETTRSLVAQRREPGAVSLVGAAARATASATVVAVLAAAATIGVGGVQGRALWEAAGPALLALPVIAAAMVVNGALAAEGRWNLLAGLALGDQLIRCGAVVLAVHLVPGELAYGVALVAGLACFVPLILVGSSQRRRISGGHMGFVTRSAGAMVSSGCANILVVGLPALITVTGDAPDRAGGVLFAAILLTRTPVLLVANSVRPVVVRVFVAHRDQLRAWVWRLAPQILLVTGAAAAAGWAFGPWALELLFGPDFTVSRGVMAGLVVAAILILIQTWTGVALTAVDRDAASTAGWVLAVAAAVGGLLLPVGLEARTLTALLVGPALGITAHLIMLAKRPIGTTPAAQPDA